MQEQIIIIRPFTTDAREGLMHASNVNRLVLSQVGDTVRPLGHGLQTYR